MPEAESRFGELDGEVSGRVRAVGPGTGVLQDGERILRRADVDQCIGVPGRGRGGEVGGARVPGRLGGAGEAGDGRVRVAPVQSLGAREQAGPGEQRGDGPVPVRVGQVRQDGLELPDEHPDGVGGSGAAEPVVQVLRGRELGAPQRDDLRVHGRGRGEPGAQARDRTGGVRHGGRGCEVDAGLRVQLLEQGPVGRLRCGVPVLPA